MHPIIAEEILRDEVRNDARGFQIPEHLRAMSLTRAGKPIDAGDDHGKEPYWLTADWPYKRAYKQGL